MFVIGSLLLISGMPPTVEDLSAVERSCPDFYQALATRTKLTTRWDVETARVPLDRDIALTLIIEAVANPTEVVPPDLGLVAPQFMKRFKLIGQVERQTSASSVRFLYRFRPLPPPGEVRLPPIKFVYYRTDFPEEIRFQTAYTPAVSLEILPAAQTSAPPASPLVGPARFTSLLTSEPWFTPAAWPWVGLPVWFTVLAVPLIHRLLQRLFPDTAQLLALSRHQAARAALTRLARADSPATVRHVLRDYFQTRFDVADVAAPNLGPSLIHDIKALLAECDAALFGGLSVNLVSLKQQAAELVLKCEASLAPARRSWWFSLLLVPFLLGMDQANPPTPEDLFRQAMARRDQPDQARELFRQAAELWSNSHQSPRQASNLARARYWSGDLPAALLVVHDALALTPWDRELQLDLQTLRDEVAYPASDPSIKPTAPRSWRHWLGPGEALVLFSMLAALLTFSLVRWLVRGTSISLALALVLVLVSIAAQVVLLHSPSPSNLAIIREPVPVYAGNSRLYDLRRVEPLPVGAEVRVRHERGGWLQVELPNRLVGWVPASACLTGFKLRS